MTHDVTIEAAGRRASQSRCRISVIICTYNPRADYLGRTLSALRAQTLPTSDWELLVVDNASPTPLSGQYDLSWHPQGRHLREEKLGKLYAWLYGMKQAGGELLIFVDDDNVLAADFLEQALVVAGQWPHIGAWGGNIVPEFEVPLPAWCQAEAWRLTMETLTTDIWSNLRDGFTTIPAGAGMCVRREVSERYLEWCRLNEKSLTLDRAGKGLGGYGDVDLAHCAIDLGLGTGKFKRLSLTHLIAASRLTLDYFVRHAEGDAASMILFRTLRQLPIQETGQLSFLQQLKWRLHCLRNRVPHEVVEIRKAYLRGIRKGLKLAEEHRKTSSNNNHGGEDL